MKALKEFTIPFVGLKLGQHHFNFTIDNTFFEHFEYTEFNAANIKLDVLLDKKTTLLEFSITFSGNVNVNCDVTNEPFEQKVEGKNHLVVNFGEEFNDEDEDLIILPHGSYEVSIAQYVYESIILSLPSRMVHPGVEDGTLKSDILDKLKELEPKALEEKKIKITEKNNNTDPRWDKLKNLLTDK